MKHPRLYAILGCLVFVCSSFGGQQSADSIMDGAPSLFYKSYQCKDMTHAANQLRHLGKTEALRVLTKYFRIQASQGQDDSGVILQCRLLFDNPDGWPPLRFGLPHPDFHSEVAKQFTCFPIGLSKGVPFFLIRGYTLEGVGESPWYYLKLCRRLKMRTEDLPTSGYTEAAQDLIKSSQFRKLYLNRSDRDAMSAIILQQATP